jgi:CBS domain-containing protein
MLLQELTARDLMNTKVISVHPADKVAAVDLLMVRKVLGGVPIVDDTEKIVGILTSRDIMISRLRTSIAGMPVDTIMTKNPITVDPDAPLEKILGLMLSHEIERIPVVENDKLVGLIDEFSVLSTIYEKIISQ